MLGIGIGDSASSGVGMGIYVGVGVLSWTTCLSVWLLFRQWVWENIFGVAFVNSMALSVPQIRVLIADTCAVEISGGPHWIITVTLALLHFATVNRQRPQIEGQLELDGRAKRASRLQIVAGSAGFILFMLIWCILPSLSSLPLWGVNSISVGKPNESSSRTVVLLTILVLMVGFLQLYRALENTAEPRATRRLLGRLVFWTSS